MVKHNSRNFRRGRQRRVVIAVTLAALIAGMLLAIIFFALMRNALG